MAIEIKQHLKLSQQLVMTPQLQQAIKLLPLTTLELAEVLEQEVMENPLLEEVPTQDAVVGDEADVLAHGLLPHLVVLGQQPHAGVGPGWDAGTGRVVAVER